MTNLTDRMRTCAAFIQARPNDAPMPTEHLLDDAAALLIAAAAALDAVPEPRGEPMEIIEVVPEPPPIKRLPEPSWTDTASDGSQLMQTTHRPSRNACPKCDSRTSKTVRLKDNQLWLECAVCSYKWPRQ
jgi:hypothetical protein